MPLLWFVLAPGLLYQEWIVAGELPMVGAFKSNLFMRVIPSVLVIDDDTETLNTFTQLLRELGVEQICRVISAEAALEVVQNQKFTMILADYQLGGMDGAEFVARLRANGDETPVVILSGVPDKAGVIRATQYQDVDFLGKPFRIVELVESMQQYAEAA